MKTFRKRLAFTTICVLGFGSATPGESFGGESLDRLGRLLGFGWSDGYHACSENGVHIGENLPPRSYAAEHSRYASHVTAVPHAHAPQPRSNCPSCNTGGYPAELDATMVAPSPETFQAAPSLAPHALVPEEVMPLLLDQPTNATRSEPLPTDEPLEREDSSSPSDLLPIPETPASPPMPEAPARKPKDMPAPKVPAPAETEEDEDLLLEPADDSLDLLDDSDGLIDELPPPTPDSLLPENSRRYRSRFRQSVVAVARVSAETAQTRPVRIKPREPQRLPSTR